MSEDAKLAKAAGPAIATMIVYCPDLDLYRYWREDQIDRMFDGKQLLEAIEAYLKQALPRDADFLAKLTGFARQFPHKIVAFDNEGKMTVGEYKKPEPEVGAGKPE